MAVLGVLGYLITSRGPSPAAVVVSGEAGGTASAQPEGAGPSWVMEPLIVNLRVPEGTRYLKLALEFELTGERYLSLADQRKGRIKDQIIEFLSDLTVDDVVGSDNKQYIKALCFAACISLNSWFNRKRGFRGRTDPQSRRG
jgi:flagellar basal body-associated protein FliL